jgi:methyl-accepting chemotaxis protein
MLKNLKIRPKLLLSLLVVGLMATTVTGLQSYRSARSALKNTTFQQLSGVREARKHQIEAYFDRVRREAITLAQGSTVRMALKDLRKGFENLSSGSDLESRKAALISYYSDQFIPELDRLAGKEVLTTGRAVPQNPAGVLLQERFISGNPNGVGLRDRLDSVGDGSDYDVAHASHHPILREIVLGLGFYDLFLIDHRTGNIVYSVSKETDFATSLSRGPYANTNLADAFKQALSAGNKKETYLVDFERYPPSRMAPASFFAAPILEKGELIGVLAIQVAIDEIDKIMTGDHHWWDEGLGSTGETYLVGEDHTLRSDSRFHIESPEAFFASLVGR